MRYKISLNKLSLPSLIIFLILIVFLFFSWFVSEPIRAAKVDRYILYYVDEVIRYFHAKASLYDPLNFLNPYAKPLSMIISNLFLRLLPFGMTSLRIMNALFSVGVLSLLLKVMKRLGFNKILIIPAILMTAAFPAYFLSSFSVLSEPMFSFFLILAIYLFYSKKYFLSVAAISLLPLIRQEGIAYLLIWLIFLLKEKNKGYIFLLFVPVFLWIMANKIILGHPFSYIFLFLTKNTKGLPADSLLNIKDLRLSYFSGYMPILFLFLAALKMKITDTKYLLLLACISVSVILITALNIFIFVIRKCLVYELRFLIPAIPLINIYVLAACDKIAGKYIRKKSFIMVFLALIFCVIISLNFYQMKQLQKLPYVLENIVTPEQEVNIRQASNWLKDYLEKEKIVNVSYRKMTHKVIRRVLMYLPGQMHFYVLGDQNVLNVATFKLEPSPKTRVIFITINNKEGIIEKLNLGLIKEFPDIPLYVYLFDNR